MLAKIICYGKDREEARRRLLQALANTRLLGVSDNRVFLAELLSHPSRSEEHTSELQSLMRISYAVFCLKKKKTNKINTYDNTKQITQIHVHNVNTSFKKHTE